MGFFDDLKNQLGDTVQTVAQGAASDLGGFLNNQISNAFGVESPQAQPAPAQPASYSMPAAISQPVASVGGMQISLGMLAVAGVVAILILRRR